MMTVNEVSRLSGVSIRTLHYYDEIGLLHPTEVTEAGYRLYDSAALERLQQIMLFRELEFPLKEIKVILDSPNFDRNRALEQQIELLTMKKEHIENLITFARGIKMLGVKRMDFSVFDKGKLDEYARRAKEQWDKTEAYKEFKEKSKNWSDSDEKTVQVELMSLFVELGKMTHMSPETNEVQEQVERIRNFITERFYNCTPQIFRGLGKMYGGGGEFTENIDAVAGPGTGEFAERAIMIYCDRVETGNA